MPSLLDRECIEQGKKYFSVASGGGTGRTLHPDNMAAGPASYGMTDTLGRMHSDAQFAGSSSVPAHVEMMASSAWATTRWWAPRWPWPWPWRRPASENHPARRNTSPEVQEG